MSNSPQQYLAKQIVRIFLLIFFPLHLTVVQASQGVECLAGVNGLVCHYPRQCFEIFPGVSVCSSSVGSEGPNFDLVLIGNCPQDVEELEALSKCTVYRLCLDEIIVIDIPMCGDPLSMGLD